MTEAKLATDRNLKLVTVKKKTKSYVDELWMKFLLNAEVIEGYKSYRNGDETQDRADLRGRRVNLKPTSGANFMFAPLHG